MRIGWVTILCITMCGCNNSNGSSSPSGSEGTLPGSEVTALNITMSQSQVMALSDGVITEVEYRSGFARYRKCLERYGYTLLENGIDHDLLQYSIPDEAEKSGKSRECKVREFAEIDYQWQRDHIEGSVQAEQYRRCLSDNGLDTSGTYIELEQRIVDRLGIEECFPR